MKLSRLLYCCVFVLAFGCKEKYELPYTGPSNGFLVVEGSINSGIGPTSIKLSRTVGLVDTVNNKPERNAQLTVEGKDNSSVALTETSPGTYTHNQLSLSAGQQYRLHIKTNSGDNYYSDYTTALNTPAIDGINWDRTDKGVELFVNTHGQQTGTRYYRWEYEETWEFHSLYYSSIQYIRNAQGNPVKVETRPPESGEKLFFCWKTEKSSRILIGSSAKLSIDSIHLPIQEIPHASWKISVLYSILVKQYSISPEEYEFLRRMKKNTEQVGSLFDAQPSELKGNIHNTNNPNELVVGFVAVCDVEEKRIFIKNSEVPGWNYSQYCEQNKVNYNAKDMEPYTFDIPVQIGDLGIRGDTLNILIGSVTCTDCSYRGSNVKPSFWP